MSYRDGDRYVPSNGTEGTSFEEDHCYQCIHTNPNPSGKKQCKIWGAAVLNWPNGKDYPKEWIYKNGKPTCTAHLKWDWGNDGDPDDPDNPNAPPPPTPINQLDLFPTYPDELYYEKNYPLFSTASR